MIPEVYIPKGGGLGLGISVLSLKWCPCMIPPIWPIAHIIQLECSRLCGCWDRKVILMTTLSSLETWNTVRAINGFSKWIFNSLSLEKGWCDFKHVTFKCNSNKHCSGMNTKGNHWWQVKIGTGNGLMPSGTKPLPEPMLNQSCHQMASLGHN